jgi:uncharacterized small protein (DUF1192 family)
LFGTLLEDAADEIERLRAQVADWKQNFDALQHALVGNTGASGITVAKQLRAQVAAHQSDWSRMHDAFKKVGWHPGRTDDLLSDILIARVSELRAQVAELKAEAEKRNESASDRLHNICQAISEQADESPFSREEWERLDALTVEQGKRIAALEVERDALKERLDPKPDEVRFWYMHDNHTFTRLTGTTVDALLAEADAIEAESPYGMLCAPTLTRNGKDFRRGKVHAHSHGADKEFWTAQKAAWRKAVEADADVMRLLDAARSAK